MPLVYSLNWAGSILKKGQLTLLKQSFSGPLSPVYSQFWQDLADVVDFSTSPSMPPSLPQTPLRRW